LFFFPSLAGRIHMKDALIVIAHLLLNAVEAAPLTEMDSG
jgi:hypothetical protein